MKFSLLKKTQLYKVIMTFFKEISLCASIVALITFYPTIAQAGIFSSLVSGVSNIILPPASASVTTSSTDSETSATMSLLTPAINVDPTPPLAEDLPVSGDALTAEVGPDGTTADVDQASSTQISVYVVRPGDNLSKIAQLFGVSVNTILWANNLTSSSVISTGDTLVILPMSGIQYKVQKGDTLQSIIKKYNADTDGVLQYNNITIDSPLTIGQTILIPDVEAINAVNISSTRHASPARLGWGAPGSNPAHNTNGPDYDSDYILPVAYATETTDLHGYDAVDLAAPMGTSIVAADSGTVIIAKSGGLWNGGYGNYVVISHPNGTQTLYAHMSKVLASVGQTVAQGQRIGLVGKTGEATGPHVHFEVRGARNPFSCRLLGESLPDLSCARIL
jgi:LysM repeat protein